MKLGKALVGLFGVMILISADVGADGKFYVREEVPPSIPYQRALIIAGEGEETLLVQSKYELPDGPGGERMGWVVPVPSVPDLASMAADDATRLFRLLALLTRPRVIRLSLLLAMAPLALCLVWAFVRSRRGQSATEPILIGLILVVLVVTLMPSLGGGGVRVLKSGDIGPYEVRVVDADSPTVLISWFQQNGFAFDEADRSAFQDYIDRGWSFVVAEIRGEDPDDPDIVSEGLVAPLIMRFETDEVVYPLVLTSLAGSRTQVLIYSLSRHKLKCDGRLQRRFASDRGYPLSQIPVEPPSFFAGREEETQYLCKFKGTLSVEQMAQDLIFERAGNDTPHRGTAVKW